MCTQLGLWAVSSSCSMSYWKLVWACRRACDPCRPFSVVSSSRVSFHLNLASSTYCNADFWSWVIFFHSCWKTFFVAKFRCSEQWARTRVWISSCCLGTQVIVAWVVIQHSLHPAAAHSFGELTTFIIIEQTATRKKASRLKTPWQDLLWWWLTAAWSWGYFWD